MSLAILLPILIVTVGALVASILLAQPALWTVPLAFAVMVGGSLRGRPPAWAAAATLRLHLDETAA